VKHRDLSYLPGTPVTGASGSLGAEIIPFRATWRSRLLVVLAIAVMTLGMAIPSYGQGTNVFNCASGFSSSGGCGVSFIGSGGKNFAVVGSNSGTTPQLSGTHVLLLQSGVQHTALSMNYVAGQVNDQAFITTVEFVPNGWTFSLMVQNSNNNPTFNGENFSAGAGCEADEYQGFSQAEPPNNVWAIVFSSTDGLTAGSNTFTYSSVQMYQPGQSPCNGNDGAATYYGTNKISTSPVPLNYPASTADTYTGDTYSATVVYTGTTVTLYLYDVTAGGSCSPITSGTCFSQTWTGVQIPAIVDGTTAWVGLGGAVPSSTPSANEYIVAWSYSTLSAAAAPTFSPTAGTYGSTQSVTISDSSSGAIICYNTTGAPATNGIAGCANGTLYSGAVSVPKGQTIYAVAGGTNYGDSRVANSAYNITGYAMQPTFNQSGGTYNGNQTVQLTTTYGGVICYNTTGSPATNGSTGCTTGTLYSSPITVSTNETIYAVAGGTGFTDSGVGSAAYTINPFAGAAPANSPTFSPVPGTYSGTQSVTLSSTTSSSYICYVLSATPPTLLPQPNNVGGCTAGTLYSAPISVSSSQTLYAMASTSRLGPPSSLTVGTYVIGGTQAPGTPTNPKANAVPQ
jgi:Chitobiase/beta-hexosaminidase C-terminal domain